MNKEFRDLITLNKEEADVILVGVPFDKNASVGKGASLAPKVLRELSYELPALDRSGNDLRSLKLFDNGDITYYTPAGDEIFADDWETKSDDTLAEWEYL